MVWRSLHHKEILFSEPGRNRKECILTRNGPFVLEIKILIENTVLKASVKLNAFTTNVTDIQLYWIDK